jgi:hypothetical protein
VTQFPVIDIAPFRHGSRQERDRELLEHVYGEFTEGLDSPVPTRARELLQAIA